MSSQSTSPAWLDRPILNDPARFFTVQNALLILILILAVLSRFIGLGDRVMSHDEVNHVVPSYSLYQGNGYRHDPVTHGPFQFHVVALSYFLFGDSDYSSRVPAAAFSVAAILFIIIAFRRYLGRSGAIIAGVLFLISPYMLFYGRYTRNEAFIELIGVVTLYGMLRYLEKGDRVAMFLVTISTALHFTIKETAFIYTAQALVFLFVMLLFETRRAEYRKPSTYNRFLLLMAGSILLVFLALGLGMMKASQESQAAQATQTEEAVTEGAESEELSATAISNLYLYGELAAVASAGVLAVMGLLLLARDLGWGFIKRLRSFSLILLISTLILPMLSPFPVSMLGWNPLDYQTMPGVLRVAAFLGLFFILAALVGLWWNPFEWLKHAFVFYAIFTVLYTTFFTNVDGFLTGIVGSLGYWLSQQGVERGSQPQYYYALVQMPIYEFIGYLGMLLAVYFGIRYRRFSHLPGFSPALAPRPTAEELPVTGLPNADPELSAVSTEPLEGEPAGEPEHLAAEDAALEQAAQLEERVAAFYSVPQPLPVLALLVYWSISSLLAYSWAGERMPWLTVHITLPFLLASGWGLGFLIDTTDWKRITRYSGLLAVLLLPVFFSSLVSGLGSLLGEHPPFQGSTLDQLHATARFLLSVVGTFASLAGIVYLLRDWAGAQILRLAAAVFFLLMAVLTARAAYRAAFIYYDYAYEYLVYAHAAAGPKQMLKQIEEISRRTSGDKSIQVAYSSDALYPYWWYLRDYPNYRWYQDTPTRDLRDFPVIIAGEDVFNKIEPIVEDNFIRYDTMRLWWPNQDYYNLTWDRIWNALSNPQIRSAVFQIWLNRDYTDYALATNQPEVFKPESWNPSARMRMYVRRDIVAMMWEYGASPAAVNPEQVDPYAEKLVDLTPVQVIGSTGSEPGQFQAPRGIKAAPDGSLYVADSRNHRIQRFAADGTLLNTWGSYADQGAGAAPGGTFYEPWDVAVGPDGSVYVSDTWNHRVQKFTADGQFVTMWGYFGQAEQPDAFWGPRGIAVDADGRVFVVDTGNKRVVIFDADGSFIAQFGEAGFNEGQFEEPVGIAFDEQGNVYITDTWNQRIQVLAPSADRQFFTPLRAWEIVGWQGESLDNKPFLAVSPVNGHVFVTDPEEPRVLEFDGEGNFIRGWGDYSTTTDGFSLAAGVTVTQEGDVWVSDAGNNWLLRFEVER